MKNPLRPHKPMMMIAIHPQSSKTLFRVYRDYLVFINLVRELVQSHGHKIFGFCWLKSEVWLLCRPSSEQFFSQLISLFKRYYLWLQHRDNTTKEFQIQAMDIQRNQTLDALRYIHSRPTDNRIVGDALDYHWHSYPIYNEFWQLNWLDTKEILDYFSSNQLLAMNAFRQHMQRPCEHDYKTLLNDRNHIVNYPAWPTPDCMKLVHEPAHPYLTKLSDLKIHFTPISSGMQLNFEMPTLTI